MLQPPSDIRPEEGWTIFSYIHGRTKTSRLKKGRKDKIGEVTMLRAAEENMAAAHS